VESAEKDSFSTGLLEHPHYTRPAIYKGMEVPEVLLSGNHALIEEWRKKESLKRTLNRRPDLLDDYQLTKEEKNLLNKIKNEEKAEKDSFSTGLLEHPHYTRPAIYKGMEVPEVLLSGNHALIEEWRKKESLKRTLNRRPDLLDDYQLTKEEKNLLNKIKNEE